MCGSMKESALGGAIVFLTLHFTNLFLRKSWLGAKRSNTSCRLTWLWPNSTGAGITYHGLQMSERGQRRRAEGSQEALKPAVASWSQRGSVFIVSNLRIHYAEYFRSNKTISFVVQWKTGLRKFLLESFKSFHRTFWLFLWTKLKHTTY